MSSIIQEIYWKVPYFIKSWMASINAWKREHERYGLAYQQILSEIDEHDKWSTEQFIEYQNKQLCFIIQHIATKVPYYREVFSKAGIDPKGINGLNDLQRLPILEKEVIRANPANLVNKELDKNRLIIGYTSGTTGTPLKLYRDIRLYSAASAYFDARCHSVAGVRRRINRSVSIGGHLVTAQQRKKPPFWVYNSRWKQLYMSSYHLSPRYLSYYFDKLRKFKAEYIEGYPTSVFAVARYILDNKLETMPFKACFTTGETLFAYQRAAIEKAFGCKMYNQYGCAEMAVFATECKHGYLHLSPEIGIVEVLDDKDQPVSDGQKGQLICTSLINSVQPFIRYRIGDIGSLSTDLCSCGSPLPVLDTIEGRKGNVLVTSDGRQIGEAALSLLLYGVKGVAEVQIIQDDYNRFRICLVPGENYEVADGQEVMANLNQRLGQVEIHLELRDKIERTVGGKSNLVICNFSNKSQPKVCK